MDQPWPKKIEDEKMYSSSFKISKPTLAFKFSESDKGKMAAFITLKKIFKVLAATSTSTTTTTVPASR